MRATIPLSVPDDLLEIVRSAASKTGLSQQDVLRQGAKIGIPQLVNQLSPGQGRITNVDPLPDDVLDRIYSRPERDEAGVDRLVKKQARGGRD